MILNIKNKEVEVKFTFNSFKYMQDFDITELQNIEQKPFKMIGVTESLLLGALNNNPKVKFSLIEIDTFIEEYIVENSLSELLEELMKKLQESNFFKSLQMKK